MSKGSKFKRQRVFAATSETREEYQKEEQKYFGARGDAVRPGLSAADAAIADQHLPSKQQEQKMLDYWEMNLTKASRSGAFSKPGSGPLILPNGRQALDFIDKHATPGQYKPQQERPVPKEATKKSDVPPAEVTITHLCIDCLKPVDEQDAANIIPSIFFILTDDTAKLFAMGVTFGAIVLAVEHLTCAKTAQELGKNGLQIILVRDGDISDPDDMAKAAQYGRVHRMHTGQELTLGQWYLQKRKTRLEEQLHHVLICMDKTSEAYRKNRKELQ